MNLYDRMTAGLLACWGQIAAGTPGASIERIDGAAVAVFPSGPERGVYNNAILERGGALPVAAVRDLYAAAGVDHYAIWAHETEPAAIAALRRPGMRVDETTRAMAMSLDAIALPRPELELAPPDWDEYLRLIEVPGDLLAGVDRSAFGVVIASVDGESAAAAMTYDHDGDCGIYNVGTLPRFRRRGIATALTALLVHDARERGCTTASLQSTPAAEGVYAAVGFRDLGRFVEYVP